MITQYIVDSSVSGETRLYCPNENCEWSYGHPNGLTLMQIIMLSCDHEKEHDPVSLSAMHDGG